jgi:hypothetical protein
VKLPGMILCCNWTVHSQVAHSEVLLWFHQIIVVAGHIFDCEITVLV